MIQLNINQFGNFESHLLTHAKNNILAPEANVLRKRLTKLTKDKRCPVNELDIKDPITFKVS